MSLAETSERCHPNEKQMSNWFTGWSRVSYLSPCSSLSDSQGKELQETAGGSLNIEREMVDQGEVFVKFRSTGLGGGGDHNSEFIHPDTEQKYRINH